MADQLGRVLLIPNHAHFLLTYACLLVCFQMARHTANYELYSAACCTDTGLAAGVPEVV